MKYLKDNKILILVLIVCTFVIFKQRQEVTEQKRLFTKLVGTQTEFQKLKNENGQLRLEYAEQAAIKANTVKKFGEEAKVLKDKIKVLSDATFVIREKARELEGSDSTFDGKNTSFVLNELRFNNGPAIGYVLIFKDGRVISKIYDHEIKVEQVVSKDEVNGKYVILAHADYVLKSPSLDSTWKNKPYRLVIKDASAMVDPTEPNYALNKKFQVWNPKLNLSIGFLPKPQPGLSVSLMSYGRSNNDADYKFLDLGTSYNGASENLELTFRPILYRPLENFLSNTYIGPGINIKEDGKIVPELGLLISL